MNGSSFDDYLIRYIQDSKKFKTVPCLHKINVVKLEIIIFWKTYKVDFIAILILVKQFQKQHNPKSFTRRILVSTDPHEHLRGIEYTECY